MTRTFLTSLSVLLLAMTPVLASAVGWSPMGATAPSAAGLGLAYAGTGARVDDPSVIAANPGGMVYLAGTQWAIGAQVQDVQAEPKLLGVTSTDIQHPVASPHFYASQQLNERLSTGLAITSPYAFESRFDASWASGQASRLRIKSRSVNPAVAYRVSDALSLGVGVNYQLLTLASEQVGGDYRGESDGLGWNAGAMVELAPYMRLGFAYRSPVQHSLTQGLRVNTPESMTFSVWQRYSDQWEASAEIGRYHLPGGLRGQSGTIQQAAFAYQDAWRVAWGATYQHNDQWKSRFGIALEKTALDGANRAARLGEDQSVWLALGLQRRLSDVGVLDLGVALRWPSRADVDNAGNAGEYRMAGYVAAIQYNHAY